MNQVKIRNAKSKDWKAIQKLNDQVFQNDKKHDPDLKLNWPYSGIGIQWVL